MLNITDSSLLTLSLILLFVSCSNKENTLSYSDVASSLSDLKSLALIPEKGEQSAMWSSYDRRSRYDEASGKYLEWYANDDGAHQQIRMEGKDAVLAEMEGPGAIVRIWSARPDTGHVKIYLDGNDEPVTDLPFIQFFDRSTPPFNYEGLVYKAAGGCNNYVPITYNKSCKVVASPGWGVYYHFNYIFFPEGTKVERFSMDLPDEATRTLDEVNDFFLHGIGQSPYKSGTADSLISGNIAIEHGSTALLAEIRGEYAVKSFKIIPSFTNREDEMTGLRKLVLTMYWDGQDEPSVWTPLGDFFGTTPAINHFKTLPSGMTDDFFYSYWYMPFSESAEIYIENQGEKSYLLEYEITVEPLTGREEKYSRFFAWWHADIFPVEQDRWPDWTLLKARGTGRFVGTMLHVMNPNGQACKEAAGEGHAWWGEGDEKFFVDGEKFPSTFGTGSEDYFGYAWGNPEFFEKAYHSQSMTTWNRDHQTIARWHIMDNIPFLNSFDGYIEKYYPNHCGTKYNSVVYWYLSPEDDNLMPITHIPVDHVLLPPEFDKKQYVGLPGETLRITITSQGDEIRYTTDGTEPDRKSSLYSGPVTVKKSCILRARCYSGEIESQASETVCRILEWLVPEKEPEGLTNGLKYSYYEKDEKWHELPDFSELEPVKTGTTENVKLGMQEREEHWGVVFTGYIVIASKGLYDFYLNSDDGSRLYIRDELVVDNDKNHAATEIGGKVALHKGVYPIRVEFFENELSQVLELNYSGPGVEKQKVPGSILFSE